MCAGFTSDRQEAIPMLWMQKLRLRVFALLAGLALLVVTVVGVFAVPVLPAIGVAVTIALTMVNSMTSRLEHMTCAGCGKDIAQLPAGTHGIVCECGTINHPFNAGEPSYAFDLSDEDDENANLA
mgnify:CR=1 FL=1|tara:strand:+ start:145292 stop:145666 length:375 start_codon:yes stop_codon:yes gene_type:complete